jgi:hypothetical protein
MNTKLLTPVALVSELLASSAHASDWYFLNHQTNRCQKPERPGPISPSVWTAILRSRGITPTVTVNRGDDGKPRWVEVEYDAPNGRGTLSSEWFVSHDVCEEMRKAWVAAGEIPDAGELE